MKNLDLVYAALTSSIPYSLGQFEIEKEVDHLKLYSTRNRKQFGCKDCFVIVSALFMDCYVTTDGNGDLYLRIY